MLVDFLINFVPTYQQTNLSEALLLFRVEVFSFDLISSGNTALCPRIKMKRNGGFPNGGIMAV